MEKTKGLSSRPQQFPPRVPSAAPTPPVNFEFSSFHQNSLGTMPNMMTSISGLGQYPLPMNRNVVNNGDQQQDTKLNTLLALQQKVSFIFTLSLYIIEVLHAGCTRYYKCLQ